MHKEAPIGTVTRAIAPLTPRLRASSLAQSPHLRYRSASSDLQLPWTDRRMGINKQSDIEANLQIGPTTEGMVRLYVEGGGLEIPMDFEPEEAEEIAEELRAAAARARAMSKRGKK